jgi:hypothetical protein
MAGKSTLDSSKIIKWCCCTRSRLPPSPRDKVLVDVLRYDTSKLNTAHRYEHLPVGTLAGKSDNDVTVHHGPASG